jgi:hypothetical protein
VNEKPSDCRAFARVVPNQVVLFVINYPRTHTGVRSGPGGAPLRYRQLQVGDHRHRRTVTSGYLSGIERSISIRTGTSQSGIFDRQDCEKNLMDGTIMCQYVS